MDFIVPQFIEREPKIVGPFNFKQSIFLGVAGATCLFLYFFIKNFILFIIIAFLIAIGALLLTFLKFGGNSLPDILKNFFIFFSRSKIYLWQKKTVVPKVLKKAPPKKEEEEKDESVLKIVERGNLRKLHTYLETKSK